MADQLAERTYRQEVQVLILDDEQEWRDILKEIVREANFTPIVTDNLVTARNILQSSPITIVVTDVSIQGALQGFWLLNDILKIHQEMGEGPLAIVVSGSDQMGLWETQQLSVTFRNIVEAFFSKRHFDDRQMINALKKAAESRQGQYEAEEDGLVYTPDDQPWYIAEFPAIQEIDSSQIEVIRNEIDIVLITATEEELSAVMRLLRPYPRRRKILKTPIGPETYYLGKFGNFRTVVTKCRMGAIDQGSVILATDQAMREWKPRAIIMVGIAFGKNPQEQGIADVLVASQIISYEQQRVGENISFRGPITPVSAVLLNRFINVPDWKFLLPNGFAARSHTGPILSGEKLIDNPKFKLELLNQYPQAIGGEMEGAGLCAATGRIGMPWILVKSICDWGDGRKHNKHQPLAAAAATSLVYHVLSQRTALDSL